MVPWCVRSVRTENVNGESRLKLELDSGLYPAERDIDGVYANLTELVYYDDFWNSYVKDFPDFLRVELNTSRLEIPHLEYLSLAMLQGEFYVAMIFRSTGMLYDVNPMAFFKNIKEQCVSEKKDILVDLEVEEYSEDQLHLAMYVEKRIELDLVGKNLPLKTMVKPFVDKVVHAAWNAKEKNQIENDGLKIRFLFPEHLKTACEQYLVYFAEFLKNIGVHADSELKRRGEEVLFSVNPINDKDALDRIQKILGIYLSLPTVNLDGLSELNEDPQSQIKIQQLVANIQFLQSQLTLSNATVTAKDREIMQLQNLNTVLMDSVKKLEVEGKEQEKFSLFDVMTVSGNVEVQMNLGKLLNKVKGLLPKKEI